MVLESLADVQVDRCPNCHALWFDAHELERRLGSQAANHARSVSEAELPERGLGGRSCPRCWPKPMETVGWTGVVIDRCPTCRGLFVEFAELERLQRHGAPEESIELIVQRAMIRTGGNLLAAAGLINILVRVIVAILRR
jgi:Zn-finger nucleic acid-binding protein